MRRAFTEAQLKPFSLPPSQFRLLSLIAAGAHSSDGFPAERVEDLGALEGRGFIARNKGWWHITPQGEAFLHSIHELLGP